MGDVTNEGLGEGINGCDFRRFNEGESNRVGK